MREKTDRKLFGRPIMNQSDFLVSVILPVYNGANFLAKAIEHILHQNYDSLEIIIVNDGSTDETAAIAARFQANFKGKVRYSYQHNRGPASARNLGIKQAKGNIIAFLDVDDLWSNNKLELQLDYLATHPEIDIVQGAIIKQTIEPLSNEIIESSSPYNFVNLGCALYRQLVFDKVGLFDETMRYGEDVDWMMRAWEQRINKIFLEEVTYYYRIHRENMTQGKNLVELGFVRKYKKRLDRLRSGNLSLKPLPPDFPTSDEYIGGEPARYIKNHHFTAISNTAWSGMLYRRLHYPYQTPFVNTYIGDRDYLKLLGNLGHYLKSPLTFPQAPQTKFAPQVNAGKLPIVGLLDGDIEIHFYHANSELEVKNNWQKRLAKINWDNLYIAYFCNPNAYQTEQIELLAAFDRLKFDFKVAFTFLANTHFSSAIYLSNYPQSDREVFVASAKAIDITSWLNKTHGSDIREYFIDND